MPILADSHVQRGRRLALVIALALTLALPVVTSVAIHADTAGMSGASAVGPALADGTPPPQLPCPGGGTPCP